MPPSENTLYLVDASIYVFRGWFTLPDTLNDSDGNPANAVIGFSDFLLQVLERERPGHLVCAFDESLTTSWRNDIYPEYKANRESAPEDLKRQFLRCRELVEACGLYGCSSPVLEADDLIATLAVNARAEGFRNLVISADKDLTQVLGPDDEWWDYAKNVRLSARGVEQRFGVRPGQISDLLALAGDKVDNIPGVPGIGQKTAAKLLNKWGDIPGMLANLDKVGDMKLRGAKRIQELLGEHAHAIEVARRITTTRHDESLPREMPAFARRAPDGGTLHDCFERLGFGDLRRRRWRAALGLGEESEEAAG